MSEIPDHQDEIKLGNVYVAPLVWFAAVLGGLWWYFS
jgi:hypothetical protein